MKAFLYYQGEEELFTHSVNELLKLAASYDKQFISVKTAKDLDRYYIPTRYLNGLAGIVPAEFFDTPEECQCAQEMAKNVLVLINEKVKCLTNNKV